MHKISSVHKNEIKIKWSNGLLLCNKVSGGDVGVTGELVSCTLMGEDPHYGSLCAALSGCARLPGCISGGPVYCGLWV